MSIDVLQDKIRKLKNPSVIDFGIETAHLPGHLLEEEGSELKAYSRFCRELMAGLKGVVPGVRFSFSSFALLGQDGLRELSAVLEYARREDFYVILDTPGVLSPWDAVRAARGCFAPGGDYPCDGAVVSSYIGSDAIKPFLPYCTSGEKALFVVLRTANRTAAELQDLITGSRLVHVAAADMVKRHGDPILGKCGYSRVCAMAGASAPDSLRNLRSKYDRTFLLVDGLDYPNANAKNCSHAFDKFGHGAAACAGPSVTAAWQNAETDGRDYVAQAVQAAERMKKNINRYITIL